MRSLISDVSRSMSSVADERRTALVHRERDRDLFAPVRATVVSTSASR